MHKTFGCRQCSSPQDQTSRPLRRAFLDLETLLCDTSTRGSQTQGKDVRARRREAECGVVGRCLGLIHFKGDRRRRSRIQSVAAVFTSLSIPSWKIKAVGHGRIKKKIQGVDSAHGAFL